MKTTITTINPEVFKELPCAERTGYTEKAKIINNIIGKTSMKYTDKVKPLLTKNLGNNVKEYIEVIMKYYEIIKKDNSPFYKKYKEIYETDNSMPIQNTKRITKSVDGTTGLKDLLKYLKSQHYTQIDNIFPLCFFLLHNHFDIADYIYKTNMNKLDNTKPYLINKEGTYILIYNYKKKNINIRRQQRITNQLLIKILDDRFFIEDAPIFQKTEQELYADIANQSKLFFKNSITLADINNIHEINKDFFLELSAEDYNKSLSRFLTQ